MKTGIIISTVILVFIAFFIVNNQGQSNQKPPAAAVSETMPKAADQPPFVETDNRWFVIENFTGECKPDEGPSKMIGNLKTLGQPYEVKEDVVIDGAPVLVRLILRDGYESGQIIYYRGKNRCNGQAEKKRQTSEAEINRYR